MKNKKKRNKEIEIRMKNLVEKIFQEKKIFYTNNIDPNDMRKNAVNTLMTPVVIKKKKNKKIKKKQRNLMKKKLKDRNIRIKNNVEKSLKRIDKIKNDTSLYRCEVCKKINFVEVPQDGYIYLKCKNCGELILTALDYEVTKYEPTYYEGTWDGALDNQEKILENDYAQGKR